MVKFSIYLNRHVFIMIFTHFPGAHVPKVHFLTLRTHMYDSTFTHVASTRVLRYIFSRYGSITRNNYGIFALLTTAASSEKVPSNIRKMRRFRSSCACAEYHPGLCSLYMYSVVSNDSVRGQ